MNNTILKLFKLTKIFLKEYILKKIIISSLIIIIYIIYKSY